MNQQEWKRAVTRLKEDKQGIKEAKYRLQQIERKKKESTTTCHLQLKKRENIGNKASVGNTPTSDRRNRKR